jgi:phosphoribosylformylglycinamidine synthase
VGVVHDLTTALAMSLGAAGDFLLLIGEPRDELTGSAFARDILGEAAGSPPSLDLGRESRLQELAVLAAEGRWARATHDVSDGGLATALAEMLMATPAERGLGIEVDLGVLEAAAAASLFSERPAIVLEVPPERAARVFHAARERSLLAWPVGAVAAAGGLRARLPGGATVSWGAEELRSAAARPLSRLWNERLEDA